MNCSWPEWFDRLVELARYPDDRDGNGSPAIERPVIDSAFALASQLAWLGAPPPVGVIPGVNGTIFFEWGTCGSNAYTEIEVEAPGVWILRRVDL